MEDSHTQRFCLMFLCYTRGWRCKHLLWFFSAHHVQINCEITDLFLMLMLFSCVFFYPLLSAILWTGELWDFLSFTERYPSIMYNILLFAVTSALGQVGGSIKKTLTVVWHRFAAMSFLKCYTLEWLCFKIPLPDLHLLDRGELWTSDLLHRHHHQEVLHHPRLCYSVWQRHEYDAVGRHHPGLPRWESVMV